MKSILILLINNRNQKVINIEWIIKFQTIIVGKKYIDNETFFISIDKKIGKNILYIFFSCQIRMRERKKNWKKQMISFSNEECVTQDHWHRKIFPVTHRENRCACNFHLCQKPFDHVSHIFNARVYIKYIHS